MTRLARRPRSRCRLRCEILQRGRRAPTGTVVSVSEGGFGIETALQVEQGDTLCIRILPRGRRRPVQVASIVWEDKPARRGRTPSDLRLLSCVVSDPPAGFLALLSELEQQHDRSLSPRVAPLTAARPTPSAGANLPRSREPLPPPKPKPAADLPNFRVRLKQVGGPRTRTIAVRASCMAEAEELARARVGEGTWELLGVLST